VEVDNFDQLIRDSNYEKVISNEEHFHRKMEEQEQHEGIELVSLV
jgi:hypothetical protein